MPTDTPTEPKPAKPAKLGAEMLTPEEQRRRFEELAREAGCDEGSEARFEAAVRRMGKTGKSKSAAKARTPTWK